MWYNGSEPGNNGRTNTMKKAKEKKKTVLVRDLKIGDKVKIAPDSPTYKVKKISSYGNSYHSLIIEFDRMLPDGMADWHFDSSTELTVAE